MQLKIAFSKLFIYQEKAHKILWEVILENEGIRSSEKLRADLIKM